MGGQFSIADVAFVSSVLFSSKLLGALCYAVSCRAALSWYMLYWGFCCAAARVAPCMALPFEQMCTMVHPLLSVLLAALQAWT